MSRANPYKFHRDAFYAQRLKSNLPLWIRVYCLAFAQCSRNGHANFNQGDIAVALEQLDEESGDLRRPNPRQINEAIRVAVKHGFLRPESQTSRQRCLVVPPEIFGGLQGNESDVCLRHEVPKPPELRAVKVPKSREPSSQNLGTREALTSGNADLSKTLLNHGDPTANGESVA